MNMNKIVVTAAVVAMLFVPQAFGAERAAVVEGEKLDSGLGDLPPGYDAAEFRPRTAALDAEQGGCEAPPAQLAEEFREFPVGECRESLPGEHPAGAAAAELQASSDR